MTSKFCSECEEQYNKLGLDWNSLNESQISHRAKMQQIEHEKHFWNKENFKYLCTVAPCYTIFRSLRDRGKHSKRYCPRKIYLQDEESNHKSVRKTGSIKLSTLSIQSFLLDVDHISYHKFGLSKEKLLERYDRFSNQTCSDEVRRRIMAKDPNDMSIFSLVGIDLIRYKLFSLLQLSIHDLSLEQTQIESQLNQLNTEEQIEAKQRINVLNRDRNELLEQLDFFEQRSKQSIEFNRTLLQLHKKLKIDKFNSTYRTIYEMMATEMKKQGKQVEPLMSEIDPRLMVDPRFIETEETSDNTTQNEEIIL